MRKDAVKGRAKALTSRLPWGVIGMLLFVAPAELFVARNAHRFMTWIEMDWKVVGQEARTKAAGADVLIFGDSMLKFGLAPTVLSEKVGRPVYSLALLDGKPASSYFLLRRALESGARPKVVLVDYQPECMCEPPDHLAENRHWKGLLSLRECWDFSRTYRDAHFFGRTALARLLPSYRCRSGVREETLLALQGLSGPNAADNARNARNRDLNRGGLLLAKKPSYNGSIPKKFWPELFSDEWGSRPGHTVYVRRFMALAARHGVRVVWVIPPNTPELERVRDSYGMLDRYTRFVQGVQKLYPNLHVVDARRAGFDHHVFIDPVHLDRDGAVAFTLGVAEALRPFLRASESPTDPAARWVSLTRPGRPDAPVELEDLEQSRKVVLGGGETVRR